MFSKIGHILQEIDFIGSPININYKGRTEVKTTYGGLLTFLITIFFLLLSNYFIIPFIQRTNPKISFQFSKSISPNQFYLNSTEFFFGVNLDNPDIAMKKQLYKYLTIKLTNIVEIDTDDGRKLNEHYIDYYDYDTGGKQGYIDSYFNLKYMGNLEFISGSKTFITDGNYFQGSPVNNIFSYFNLKISLNYKALLQDFKTSDDVLNYTKNLFKNSRVILIYSDLRIDMFDYKKPYEKFISFYQTDLQLLFKKNINLDFVSNYFVLDNNYILDIDSNSEEYLMHYETSEKTGEIFPEKFDNDRILINCKISKIKYTFSYKRYYIKFLEMISFIGGTIIFFYVIIFFLGFSLIKYQMNAELISLLYDIDFDDNSDSDKKERDMKRNISKRIDIKNVHHSVENYIRILKKREDDDRKLKNIEKLGKRARMLGKDPGVLEENYILTYVNDKFGLNTETSENKDEIEKVNKRKTEENDENIENIENEFLPSNHRLKKSIDENENKNMIISMMKKNSKKTNKQTANKNNKYDDIFFQSDSFNFLDCLVLFFEEKVLCRNNKTNKKSFLFDAAKKEMSKNIAINNIVAKFYEVDLIKYFIMSKDQINLFKMITRPQISQREIYNSNDFEKIFENFRDFELQKDSEWKDSFLESGEGNRQKEISLSYANVINKDKKSVIDNKLLKCIEKNILEFIFSDMD